MISGFVITKIGDAISEGMASECIASGKTHGVDIKIFPGVYTDIDKKLKEENLFLNPEALKKIQTKGVIGCFLSHYSLWKKCVEENNPIAVFEYDAIVINDVDVGILNQFDDYLNLDFSRHLYLKDIPLYVSKLISVNSVKTVKLEEDKKTLNKNSYKYMNRNHIKGAYSYILKPSGAKKLIEGVKRDGVVPADVAINLRYLNLYYTDNSVARLNPIMLQDLAGLSHTKN